MLSSKAWESRQLRKEGKVDFLLSVSTARRVRAKHPKYELESGGQFYELPETSEDGSWKGRWRIYLEAQKLFWKGEYTQFLCGYGDYYLIFLPLIKLLRPSCRITCLYFRPLIHYRKMGYSVGEKAGQERGKWAALWKDILLLILLRIKLVSSVAFQDEGAVEWYLSWRTDTIFFPAPPSSPCHRLAEKESSLRMGFLLFGAISARKGVYEVLRGFSALSLKMKGRVALKIVGRFDPRDEATLLTKIDEAKKDGVQVTSENRFIDQNEIAGLYEESDVILLLYQGLVVGGSGVLVQAAAMGRPVLASKTGWCGKAVEKYQLGATLPDQQWGSICSSVERFVAGGVRYNKEGAAQFSALNSAEKYGEAMVRLIS